MFFIYDEREIISMYETIEKTKKRYNCKVKGKYHLEMKKELEWSPSKEE